MVQPYFYRLYLIVGLSLIALTSLSARHIIGGVMSYECLGNDEYRFTLKMYRDCYCSDCAQLDAQASIGVYRCNGAECNNLTQMSTFLRMDVPLQSRSSIDAPDYPCLIPPDVCVEEGLYVFTLRLPKSDRSYHISYQRCCRNITINNIIDPENTGATYTIELTPAAQALCNNSPVFADYPPSVICNGIPLEFDHSATDADGDQLVYEFCNPLIGGGPLLEIPVYTTCDGASPIPACPPPYPFVRFRAPDYTASQPMAGNPMVTIDANTGLITGTPRMTGQYVVGVCVSEYRNGQLLSRVFRDFQFNVAPCDPTVVADIKEDSLVGTQAFLVNSCGENTITFQNESFQERFIDNFEWRFNIDGQTQIINEWDPTVTFPDVGQYQGTLILNKNTNCGDTASIFVNIFPAINADFDFTYDTCVAGPVEFEDLSTTGACCLTNWQWDFGDGGSSRRRHPTYQYRAPGDLPVTLTVRDTNRCVDQVTKNLSYFPVPALIVIAPIDASACLPASIFFDNLSTPIDETYDIEWDFGDGGGSNEISPTYVFENSGVFNVSVRITSPIGCMTDTSFNNLITILPSPEAGFTYAPDQPSNLLPQVTFTDQSQGARLWLWDFGNGQTTNIPSPVYTFPDTGLYTVQQIVTHPSGCRDTAIALIDVIPEVRYFLPNAYTPNGDGTNDGFRGKGILAGARNFRFTIWNRWGELIFETTNPDDSWNGRKNNTGAESPPGVYLVYVEFLGPRGERHSFKEFVTLLR